MTYRLNVCFLSGVFEKSFGLSGFYEDYHNLLKGLGFVADNISGIEYTKYPNIDSYVKDWSKNYRLFCKLSHFFDDFNFFINIQLSPKITQERYSKFSNVDDGFRAFIRRVESMKIPQQTQSIIVGFLKVQRAKAALVAIRENSWLVPKLLPQGDLNILHGKPKLYITNDYLETLGAALNKEAEIGEDGLNRFDQTRAELLQQLATTLQKLPYIRLGQLLSTSMPEGTDLFYVTDAKLIQLLKDFEAKNGLS